MAMRTKQPPQPAAGADEQPPAPRWRCIARDIAADIERGRHVRGETLPSASSIAAHYAVNRHTVRQALRHLQDMGLVTVERGRGTTVRAERFPYRLGRRVSFRANFGAAGIDAGGDVLESGIEAATEAVSEILRLSVGAPVWRVRTLSRAAGTPVSTSLHYLSVARFPEFDARLLAARASISAALASYGIHDYVRLSTRLSARQATHEEARILGLSRTASVMQSVAIDGLETGDPLQYVVGAFAGDRVEMVLEHAEVRWPAAR
jgi:GntR family phosphonate transport system transcriptional regulator